MSDNVMVESYSYYVRHLANLHANKGPRRRTGSIPFPLRLNLVPGCANVHCPVAWKRCQWYGCMRLTVSSVLISGSHNMRRRKGTKQEGAPLFRRGCDGVVNENMSIEGRWRSGATLKGL